MYKDNFLAIAILSCFSLIFQVPRTPRSFAASRSCPHRVLLYPITKEDPPDLNFWYMDGAAFQTRLPCGGRKAGQPRGAGLPAEPKAGAPRTLY